MKQKSFSPAGAGAIYRASVSGERGECPKCGRACHGKIRQYSEAPHLADIGWLCLVCDYEFGFEFSDPSPAGAAVTVRTLALAIAAADPARCAK